MTALCPGGGASEPKPGTDPVITLAGVALDALVSSFGFPELAPIIAAIAGGTTLVTNEFCTTDPPPDPGLTTTDVTNVLEPTSPATFATSAGRIKDWVLHQYWSVACQCSGGAVTPPPPAPNLPTGVGTNTGLPTGAPAGLCWNVSVPIQIAAAPGGPTVNTFNNITQQLLPSGPEITVTGIGPQPNQPAVAIPTGANHGTLTFNLPGGTPSAWNTTAYVVFYDSSGNELSGFQASISSTQPPPQTSTIVTFPATAAYWNATVISNNQPATNGVVSFEFACPGTPPGSLASPCCPPDPNVQNQLQLILNLVQQIYQAPGAAPPTGWADATAHNGISGTGSFQLGTNVTGIRAAFTTIPADIRITPGTPPFYWSLGFVTPVAIDVPLRSLRTVFAAQAMQLPPQATAIDYTFPAGVVVDLVELVPA